VCQRLKRAVGNQTRTYSYSSDIKEILVFGDVAVVRLVWTRSSIRSSSKVKKTVMFVEKDDQRARRRNRRRAWLIKKVEDNPGGENTPRRFIPPLLSKS